MSITTPDRLALVVEASRAPSAHNTQPARWRFEEPDRLVLLEALGARLPAADPESRDARIGLGAALEGMALALSERGFGLTGLRKAHLSERDPNEPATRGTRVVATARIVPLDERDPLAERVLSRRTFRGQFTRGPGDTDALKTFAADRPDVIVVESPTHVRELARLHDRASARFFRRRGYAPELCAWLRLSRSHPRWSQDGLSAECLSLSWAEAVAARLVMRPSVLHLLTALRLVGFVLSEAAVTRSAAALVVLTAQDRDAFDAGRLLYRRWLELDAAGWSACPMSALVDDEDAAQRVREVCGLPADATLVSVLRVGRTPDALPPKSARLPPERLLV